MNNSRLVFQPGNQWRKDAEVAPFFVVPGWWRRFVYRVLSAREYVVYSYLCSVFDKNAIAYPTIEQISIDVGLRSRVIVSRAIDQLVALGFIIRGPALVRGRLLSKRPVYQRPLAAFTLLRLIEHNIIDQDLYPKLTDPAERDGDFAQSAVEMGLRNVLGRDLFEAYLSAMDSKRAVLIAALRQVVKTSVAEAATRDLKRIRDLPEEVSAILGEEHGVPF